MKVKFKKVVLDDMERCYCVAHMVIKDEDFYIYASEANPGVCYAYHDEFRKKEIIWDNIGGTMSIVPFSDREGEFLAITEMYLKESPSRQTVVWAKRVDDNWIVKPILHIPYLHRFDILSRDGTDYFIGASIARDKMYKDDWRQPGQLLTGIIPKDLDNDSIIIKVIKDDMFINHGFTRKDDTFYFGTHNGLFTLKLDSNKNWKIEKILDGQIGEIAVGDLNGDGCNELFTIEPFHGNNVNIYETVNGKYEKVKTFTEGIEFAHALAYGSIDNAKTVIVGVRKGNEELSAISFKDNNYNKEVIDYNVGPANVLIANTNNTDIILSANHTSKQACIYLNNK